MFYNLTHLIPPFNNIFTDIVRLHIEVWSIYPPLQTPTRYAY